MRWILGATLLAVAIPGARLARFALAPLDSANPATAIIEVQKGKGPKEIVRLLHDSRVIEDKAQFLWLGRVTRQWARLKAGEYQVSSAQSPIEIFSVITSGISVAFPLTVREGENMYEIADDLQAKKLGDEKEFLKLCRSPAFMKELGFQPPLPPSLEGYLFPDTYLINKTVSTSDLIRQMVKRFQAHWTAELDQKAKALGFTQHQAVTLASIVEKETGAPSERPKISSVFHNRLRKKMRLQSDPTTIYGMWQTYEGNIHRSDLTRPTPYNTYTVAALPVGPISNPGAEALKAALFPESTEYLFFVSHNDGTHEFTSTYKEHMAAVKRFQLNPEAREGKSWRDLNRKGANTSAP